MLFRASGYQRKSNEYSEVYIVASDFIEAAKEFNHWNNTKEKNVELMNLEKMEGKVINETKNS